MKLKQCGCGKSPTEVHLIGWGPQDKWARCSGNCCGEWQIEFRANYTNDIFTAKKLAMEAWNDAPRNQATEPPYIPTTVLREIFFVAFCWNEHNYDFSTLIAKAQSVAKTLKVSNLEEANKFLEKHNEQQALLDD